MSKELAQLTSANENMQELCSVKVMMMMMMMMMMLMMMNMKVMMNTLMMIFLGWVVVPRGYCECYDDGDDEYEYEGYDE